jgi:hypothetical protein
VGDDVSEEVTRVELRRGRSLRVLLLGHVVLRRDDVLSRVSSSERVRPKEGRGLGGLREESHILVKAGCL